MVPWALVDHPVKRIIVKITIVDKMYCLEVEAIKLFAFFTEFVTLHFFFKVCLSLAILIGGGGTCTYH